MSIDEFNNVVVWETSYRCALIHDLMDDKEMNDFYEKNKDAVDFNDLLINYLADHGRMDRLVDNGVQIDIDTDY